MIRIVQGFLNAVSTIEKAVVVLSFSAVLAATALQAAVPLATLESKTREVIRDAVLDAVANPLCDGARGGRPRGPSVVKKLVVFLEDLRSSNGLLTHGFLKEVFSWVVASRFVFYPRCEST